MPPAEEKGSEPAPAEPAKRSVASRRSGGKFGGGGGGGAAARRGRGKFLNKPPGADAADGEGAAGGTGTGSGADASRKRKRREARRAAEAGLASSLDEAEALALELLGLAEGTAAALSAGAAGRGGTGGEGAPSLDEIASEAKRSGQEYLRKVGRIHALLAPHANRVVPYVAGAATSSASPPASASASAPARAAEGGEAKVDAGGDSGDAPPRRRNMDAARMEMRLATERRDVLRQFLMLEKEVEAEAGQEGDKQAQAKAGDKRRRT